MIAKLFPSMTTLAWCGLALCAASAAMAQERTPTAQDVLAKDLRVLLEYFPGRYDNDLQVYFDGELKTPEIERNGRIHSIFAPLLKALAVNVSCELRRNDILDELISLLRRCVEKAIKLEIFCAFSRPSTGDPRGISGSPPNLHS